MACGGASGIWGICGRFMSAKNTLETKAPAPSMTPRRIPQVTAPIAARLGPSAYDEVKTTSGDE
jgi:hypothetical protein